MFRNTDLQESFKRSIAEIKKESEELRKIYDSFFDFNIILTSDTGSKTAVNKDYIYDSNQLLKESTAIINAIFDEMFLSFKKYILNLIPKKHKKEFEISGFIFDNEIFFNDIDRLITDKRVKLHIKNILFIKDKLYTLKYVLKKANTLPVCKKLNKMNTKELQDSQTIFKIIDHLGILANNFQDFNNRVQNFEEIYTDEVDLDLNFLDSIIVTEEVNIEEFIYQNKKYRFLLDYENLSQKSQKLYLDKVYLENILSNLVEQACLDVIKKERYSSKSDRTITLKASLEKMNLVLICKCDGIYKKLNEDNIPLDNENQTLIHAKNLANYIDGNISVDDSKSFLEYKAVVKLDKKIKSEMDNQEV